MMKAVRPGGLLVYKTYTRAQAKLAGGPKNPAHLLEPGELLHLAGGLRVSHSINKDQNLEDCDTGGIGGTLAGNALSLAAMRATLTKVLTKDAFVRMIPPAERWAAGVQKTINDFGVPWHVTRLGCRAEYQFSTTPPNNGAQAHDAMDFELERFMHLYAMNRGILLTPFHNMALMSPQTDPNDVDQHSRVFREAVKDLVL
jgi:glutamate-1-semialdehyde 2,1-aminomutase